MLHERLFVAMKYFSELLVRSLILFPASPLFPGYCGTNRVPFPLINVSYLCDDLASVFFIENGKSLGTAERGRVTLQYIQSEGMKGADVKIPLRHFPRHDTCNALSHLSSRPVAEGDGNDGVCIDTFMNKTGGATGEHPRLSCTRTCKDQRRASSVHRRLLLFRVELREQVRQREYRCEERRPIMTGLRQYTPQFPVCVNVKVEEIPPPLLWRHAPAPRSFLGHIRCIVRDMG